VVASALLGAATGLLCRRQAKKNSNKSQAWPATTTSTNAVATTTYDRKRRRGLVLDGVSTIVETNTQQKLKPGVRRSYNGESNTTSTVPDMVTEKTPPRSKKERRCTRISPGHGMITRSHTKRRGGHNLRLPE